MRVAVKQLAQRNNSNSGALTSHKFGSHRINFIKENIKNVKEKRNSKFSTGNLLYSPRSSRGSSVNNVQLKGFKNPPEEPEVKEPELNYNKML